MKKTKLMGRRYFKSKIKIQKTYLASIVISKEITLIRLAITNLKQAIKLKINHFLTPANFYLGRISRI